MHSSDKTGNRCPCCFEVDGFESTHVEDKRWPWVSQVTCGGCGYTVPEDYLHLDWFRLAGLGMPDAGRTHWLVTVYETVRKQNIGLGEACKIVLAPSVRDDIYDALSEMVKRHGSPPATQNQSPMPLLFRARKAANPASSSIVGIFDYGANAMQSSARHCIERRHALSSDGFVVFLDAMAVDRSIVGLKHFCRDLALFRCSESWTGMSLNVAICLPKLDLFATRSRLSTAANNLIRELKQTVHARPTLALVQARSRMCEEVLPRLFPAWDVMGILRKYLGEHFMFFPLTPIGLEERGLAIEDSSFQTLEPFGVLEPLLWLLEMDGLSAFDEVRLR